MRLQTPHPAILGLTLLISTVPSLGHAQDTPEAQGGILEEVIVTARKRAENLQEVPDAITVFGQDQIESAGIMNVRDFADLTPNLSWNEGFQAGTPRISIRGLITPQVGDAPVAYVVDGITAAAMDFISQEIFAIERIEVLKGPQGALYGKGAVGGAINITTRSPTDEYEGEFTGVVGNGDSKRVTAYVSGPIISDSLYFTLGGTYTDFGGLIKNDHLNKEVDFDETSSIQGLLRYDVTEDVTLDFRARYTDTTAGMGIYDLFIPVENLDQSYDKNLPSSNILGLNTRNILDVSVKLDWNMQHGDLVFVAGYGDVDDNAFADLDFTHFPALVDFDQGLFFFAQAQEVLTETEVYTSELRFTSDSDGRFNWQVGAYYQYRERNAVFNLWDDWDGVNERDRASFGPIPIDEFLFINDDPYFETEYVASTVDKNISDSWAVFGQMNYDISESFELSFALRYDKDKRESSDWRDESTLIKNTYSEPQPKIQLSYDINDEMMAYVSASKGFRSGGFNEPRESIIREFDKEVSQNIEFGMKTTLLDHTMTLNAAVFFTNTDDTQFTRFNEFEFTLENLNIDESSANGFEIETIFKPTSNLRLNASYGYVDSKVDAFTEMDLSPPVEDITGNKIPGVFRSNFNLGAEYYMSVSDNMQLRFRLDYLRNGPIWWDLENEIKSGTTNFVDARISLVAEKWILTLFGQNLTDERMPTDAFVQDSFAGTFGRQANRPRYYGLEVRYAF